jgi:outer membrane protein assembly factor BamB
MKKSLWTPILIVIPVLVLLSSFPLFTAAYSGRGDAASSSAAVEASRHWPQFRGANAAGTAEGQDLPLEWDVKTGVNIRWKTAIPGLGHSSPVIWADRVFVTTASAEGKEAYLKVGRYGQSPDNPEDYDHDYKVYCLDKETGDVIWERTSYTGKPKVKRHIKSSHANCTPATDGKHLLVFFGSQGLYCYDLDGKLLWTRDLGYLDAGAFDVPEVQWGFASSPIIYEDKVIVLCDVNNQSFITALELKSGEAATKSRPGRRSGGCGAEGMSPARRRCWDTGWSSSRTPTAGCGPSMPSGWMPKATSR